MIEPLAERLVRRLEAHRDTLATAESCTGGLLGHSLTSVPGASAAYLGGLIAYSNAVKANLLGVPLGVLEAHGAVSEPCAQAMAQGVRERFGSTLGVGITGIAGPGGGTLDKPVGLVYIATSYDGASAVFRHEFEGDRDRVKAQSADAALQHLLEALP